MELKVLKRWMKEYENNSVKAFNIDHLKCCFKKKLVFPRWNSINFLLTALFKLAKLNQRI